MSTSGMGGESMGEESGRDPAGPAGDPAPRRRRTGGGQLVGRVVATLAVEVAQAAVSTWAPEWSGAAQALTAAARAALRLRRSRGGRPRG
ncbi:hypothetical protein ACIQU4_40130 [Streptomyces sp. NPDC090741]|uniref:hypothetical protein n=1 Tax=Streptomyces sp. NPDC090741 TaxID=3365967 RepID=UPI00380C1C68